LLGLCIALGLGLRKPDNIWIGQGGHDQKEKQENK